MISHNICFGGDGLGNYGLWWSADYYNVVIDIIPVTSFHSDYRNRYWQCWNSHSTSIPL